jgi:phage-related tail protein
MESFIDGYSYFAPVAIYLILVPTLTKLFLSEARGKSFAKLTDEAKERAQAIIDNNHRLPAGY